MSRKFLLIPGILLAVFLFLAACSQSTTTSPKPTPPLENTTWKLQSYGQPGNLKPVLTSSDGLKNIEITLVFGSANDQVSGSGGINKYGGIYELKDNKLSILKLVSTLIGGPQPLADQETEFLKLLGAAESYQIADGRLQINCGGPVLLFAEKK